ncbi:ankyrin repeat domain-containing protein [Treponema sp. Marseille-Q4132]|uniref:ankyrin repeat domain-containing protein n=1 Tax=Treponema sp. Marseille-Q4132 TaxID=2766701 RepID=UPI001652C0D9|nr:ankyrin repeat domain-containing protein [Treponema sp. Marseille-Q4132]QNL97309.1 ankyrin repeat domain-containing protein [Treponema sp. Marseille-Q4132]
MIKKTITYALAFIFCVFIFGCASTPKERSVVALILSGKENEAKSLFQSKYDINETDASGNTPLHAAAIVDDADLALFLLIKGADDTKVNFDGDTPLHAAIKNDSFGAARIFAENGSGVFVRNAYGKTAFEEGFEKSEAYERIFITQKTGSARDTDGNTIVHYCVRMQNEGAVRECIKKSIAVSVQNKAGKTPLDIALGNSADEKSVAIAADLIMAGAETNDSQFSYFQTAVSERNFNYRFGDGQTPLHIASIKNHKSIARYLIANGAHTSAQDITGATPLHEAVRYGDTDIAKALLESGADVNAEDNLGKTPVMLVIPEDKREAMYRILLAYKADTAKKDAYGDTVLHSATMTSLTPAVLEMLTASEADVNARNKDGVSPLLIAVQKRNLSHVKFYAERGADINSADRSGTTPLSLALKDGQAMLEMLVNRANALSHDSNGNTPLHTAVIVNASIEQIRYLVSLTDDINARNKDGNNALYLAVERNNKKIGELLLAKNADIFSTNNANDSPLHLALKKGGDIQGWLVTSRTITSTDGSGNTALHYAVEWDLKKAALSLIEKGANPEAKNANGETPLFSAVKTNDPAMIALIVKGGSSIKARDNLGSSPLHAAVRRDADASVRELVRLGIDVNAQNVAGKSALSEAVLAEKIPTAKLLIDSGADINASDNTGRTILMDAIRSRNTGVIAMLLSNKANPQIQEINGRNAYHEAVLTGDARIIALVRDAGGKALSRDKNANTPFSLAFDKSDDLVKIVLGNDRTITDSDGNTPFHIIVQAKGPLRILSLLASLGYPFDTRNAEGMTPLGYAVENNDENYARILLQNGANPFSSIDKKGRNAATIALANEERILADIAKYAGTKSDIQGNTLLHYAARTASADTIRKLLAYGLDANAKNISGETPYMTALRWKRNDAADVLKAAENAKR